MQFAVLVLLESETCEHDTFSRPAWIKCLHHEMKSCQTAVALFDLTSLAKFELMVSYRTLVM